jgi:hypothetical protein
MMRRRAFRFVLTLVAVVGMSSIVLADVWVNGYTRSNGTYVQGHWRSDPDGKAYNNWSTEGNVNPHTGKPGYKKIIDYHR